MSSLTSGGPRTTCWNPLDQRTRRSGRTETTHVVLGWAQNVSSSEKSRSTNQMPSRLNSWPKPTVNLNQTNRRFNIVKCHAFGTCCDWPVGCFDESYSWAHSLYSHSTWTFFIMLGTRQCQMLDLSAAQSYDWQILNVLYKRLKPLAV